jgi:hypothetical protein
MNLTIREATIDDAWHLAQMNEQLIVDEESRNPMDLTQLIEMMNSILSGEWKALIISKEAEDIGYMVYKVSPDEYFPDKNELHIRQYFVKRQHRGCGVGVQAFETILRDYSPENVTLTRAPT